MKKLLQLGLLAIIVFCSASAVEAQSSLIHYWNFNNLAQAYNNPNIPPLVADYTVLDTSKAKIVYLSEPGTSPNYLGYIDNVASADTTNNRLGAVAGQALRVRNPTDSMELRFYIPTTGYQGIVLKYALESSSTTSGDSTELFDYSVDSGKTWKTTGLTVNGSAVDTLDTTPLVYQGSSWGLVTITFGNDAGVNNNPGLVFRMKFARNSYKTSGNNRFDNVTVEGLGASKPPPATFTLVKPVGGEIYVGGRHATLSFNTYGPITDKRTIDYSTDDGVTWSNVTVLTKDSNFVWTVPNSPTTTGLIRVKDDNGVTSVSKPFTIVAISKSNTLIQYWSFNTLLKQYNNPNIPTLPADFSALENGVGSIVYMLEPGTSKSYLGYIDNVAGDTLNARLGQSAGQGLRVRNPTDSMELRFNIPTTGYHNITIHYDLQSSDSAMAPLTEHFDYSVDGGSSWRTSGLNMTTLDVRQKQYQQPTKFGLVSIAFTNDTAVNNNANLVFRIKFTDETSITSGNNRFDNFTVDGALLPASVPLSGTRQTAYSVFPNPTADQINVVTPSAGLKLVSVVDVAGRVVLERTETQKDVLLNTTALHSGVYFLRIQDAATGGSALLKFVKE